MQNNKLGWKLAMHDLQNVDPHSSSSTILYKAYSKSLIFTNHNAIITTDWITNPKSNRCNARRLIDLVVQMLHDIHQSS